MRYLTAILALLLMTACQSAGGKFPERHTLAERAYTVASTSRILVVYIGAWDCPPCFVYKRRDHPVWVASEEYKHVEFHGLDFPSFARTDEDRYWPADLRWLREATRAQRGAPRWLIAVDGRVVSNEKSWHGKTYPLIQRLVARKLQR